MEFAIAGSASSLFSTFLLYPIDTLKSRIQINNTVKSGLYKGLRYELLSCVPSAFTYWYAFAYCREQKLNNTYSSLIAAVCSNVVDAPFDLKKKKSQLFNYQDIKIYRYCAANVLSSVFYNIVYINTLKFCRDEKKLSNTVSIIASSTLSSIVSYPFDRWKTLLVNRENVGTKFFKGLLYRMFYCNLYSGIYMHLFLYFSKNIIP